MLLTILFFTLIGSVLSLIGGCILLFSKKIILNLSHLLLSFAAGTLLGTAFFDLIPEAIEETKSTGIILWVVLGVLLFFIIERFLNWFHFHNHEEWEEGRTKPTIPLIILGDSIHNFIDGVVIAATFLVNIPLGIVTTLAVAAHEIPQEIGDFAILIHKGFSRKKAIFVNILSALASVLGALITFFLRDSIQNLLPIFLSVTAGFFIYISSSDLIPEIHEHRRKKGFALFETILLIVGAFLVYFLVGIFE